MHLHKNKIIPALLILLLISCILCGCGQTEDSSDGSADNSELPILKIGTDTIKPFFYIGDDGEYAGIDADLAREACRRAGYEPQFVNLPWSERDNYMNDGSVDCIWNAFIKDGREDEYLWTDTYLKSSLSVIVDERTPDRRLTELKNSINIAVRAGSRAEQILLQSDELDIPVYSCGTFKMTETAFVKGYAGALAGHRIVLQQIINDYPGMYRFLDDQISDIDLAVAFRKDGNVQLMNDINNALKAMKQDGTVSDIIKKYDAKASVYEEDSDVRN